MNIDNLTEQQLIDLNDRVIERIKQLRRSASMRNKRILRAGQTVTFVDNYGVETRGLVVKVNRTKAKIRVRNPGDYSHTTWNVPMNMLTIVD